MYDQVMAVTFDTLKASRRLQDAGFDEEKADALVSIFAGEIGASLSTKDDVAAVRTDMKHMEERFDQKIDAVRADMKHMEERLEQKIAQSEHRLMIRMGAMTGGSVAVLLAALGVVTAILLAAG